MKTFNQLPIGTRFDFISGTSFDSFFLACMKTGPRSYVDSMGMKHRVGSVGAKIYNIGRNF
jgi:hypothetical protein